MTSIDVVGWSRRPLGNCGRWLSGGTPRKSEAAYWGGDIPWISAKSLKRFFVEDAEMRVTDLGAKNGTRLVEKGTILFIVRGMSLKTEFRIGITRRRVTFNQDLKALVASPGVDPLFLVYAIRAHTPEILGLVDEAGHGTGRLPTDLLQGLEIPLPPIDEQRRIAAVFGALDDKIELNRKMNRTLEEMAQAIFKSWFIDFDGVDASEMVDSELGPIPKGWTTQSLYESAIYVNGAAYRKFHFSDAAGALPIVKIAELKNGVYKQTKFTTTQLADKYRIGSGDILFSWSGNPDTSIDTFVWTGGPAWLNQHIFRVSPRNEVERYFVYYLLKFLRPVFAETARDKQTTGLGHVTGRDLKRMTVVHPSAHVLREFNAVAGPLFERWYLSLNESRTLASLRDALLPKLISGEIRVPAAAKTIEAVL